MKNLLRDNVNIERYPLNKCYEAWCYEMMIKIDVKFAPPRRGAFSISSGMGPTSPSPSDTGRKGLKGHERRPSDVSTPAYKISMGGVK